MFKTTKELELADLQDVNHNVSTKSFQLIIFITVTSSHSFHAQSISIFILKETWVW